MYVALYNGTNCIIKVTEEGEEQFLVKEGRVMYPVQTVTGNIVYFQRGDDLDKVWVFDAEKDTKQLLFSGKVHDESKLSISDSEQILFVEKVDEKYWISTLNLNGESVKLIEGRFPVWLEDDKKFIYYYDKGVRIFDISTNTSEIIQKTVITGTPSLNIDRTYMAIFEPEASGGEVIDFLKVMSIKNGDKVTISAFHKTRRTDSWGGVEWIKKY